MQAMLYLLRLRASVDPATMETAPAMHTLAVARAALSPVAGSAFLPFVCFFAVVTVLLSLASPFALSGLSVGVGLASWSESSIVRDSSPLPSVPPLMPLPPAIWRLAALVVTVTLKWP